MVMNFLVVHTHTTESVGVYTHVMHQMTHTIVGLTV